MTDGSQNINSIKSWDYVRFQDAATRIYFKYGKMDQTKTNDDNITATTIPKDRIIRDRPETAVKSQACIIL